MALLAERQQLAAALSRELHKLGVAVINPMPLPDDKRLRFQVLDTDRHKVLERLCWNWGPICCGTMPRVCFDGMKFAHVPLKALTLTAL